MVLLMMMLLLLLMNMMACGRGFGGYGVGEDDGVRHDHPAASRSSRRSR